MLNVKLLFRDRGEGGWGKDVCKGFVLYLYVGEVIIFLVV